MADDWQLPDPRRPGPCFEPIGQDDGGRQPLGDGAAESTSGPVFGPEVRAAAVDWWRVVHTLRFWSSTMGAAVAMGVVVGTLSLLFGGADEPAGSMPVTAYLLALLLLPAASAFVAMHWGMDCWRRSVGPGWPAGLVAPIVASIMRSLVFAVLILAVLLALAAMAGQPAAPAAVSAVVAAVEAGFFSGMGTAVASLVRNRAWAGVAGWFVALFLVAGGIGTCVLLLPAVRSEEPVTVAMNVQQAQDGTFLAYECSRVQAGTTEVYRTERIMWLAASSPSVVFVMLAAGQDAAKEPFGWLSSRLQEAADGTQVPCVNGEPLGGEATHVPLGATGLLIQGVVAGALVAGARMASKRRLRQENPAVPDAAADGGPVRPGRFDGLRRRGPK
ncbi:hypothetical protein [Pseudarthrobacter sp. efr-133-R2A-89]|uniref:hypothetical protein n=1 Tax=Pseudarthrobacter sp. efr-133-R2A-89 TaxID=3040302 RepID=UPI0025521A92|nr:hypothetical protein [Pseudarthrobacter sp. efr-133-R2A-89]